MAQKPVISVGLKIDELDKQDIEKIMKSVKSISDKIDLDPRIKGIRKQIDELKKEESDIAKSRERSAHRLTQLQSAHGKITQKMLNDSKKLADLEKDRASLAEKHDLEMQVSQSKINSLLRNRVALEKDIADQLQKIQDIKDGKSEGDTEKVNKKLADNQNKLAKINENIGIEEKKRQILKNKAEQELYNITENIQTIAKTNNDLKEKSNKFTEDGKKLNAQILENEKSRFNINDNIIKQKEQIKGIEKEQFNYASKSFTDQIKFQHELANQIQQTHPEYSHDEALVLAKKMTPLKKEGLKIDTKDEELIRKSLKNRKLEYKLERDKEKSRFNLLGLGKKDWKERNKELLTEFDLKKRMLGLGVKGVDRRDKVGMGGVVSDLAKGENVAEKMTGQMGALGAVIGKLAGPLMAIGGIAGFVMLMLEYNQKVQEARKSVLQLGAASGQAWKNIQRGQILGLDSAEKYRASLRSLYDEIGMTYEDALKNTEILNKSSVAFQNILSGDLRVLKEIDAMAVLNNTSFQEMATISGDWVNELNIKTNQLFTTFVKLRDAQSGSSVTVDKFFSSVMNAAQGLAIYGTQVEDVATAFGKLTKNLKMPQKYALDLATKMLSASSTMTASQKTMVSQIGGAKGLLEQETKRLEAQVAQGNEQKKQGKLSKDQVAELERQTQKLGKNREVLGRTYKTEIDAQAAYFEAMDPSTNLKMRLQALAKSAPSYFKGVDFDKLDPKKLAAALAEGGETLADIAKEFGFDREQIRAMQKFSEAGVDLSNLGAKIATEQDKAAKARETETARKQAHTIEDGTKSIKEILAEKIGKFLEKIYLTLENIYDFFAESVFASKATKIRRAEDKMNKGIEGINDKIKDLTTEEERLKKEGTTRPLTMKEQRRLGEIDSEKKALTEDAKKIESKKSTLSYGSGGAALDLARKALSDQQFNESVRNAPRLKRQEEEKKQAQEGKLQEKQYAPIRFASGGYTGDGKPTNAAGIVHKKEFVFDAVSTRKIGKDNLEKLMAFAKNGFAAGGYVGTAAKIARSGFKIGSAIGTKAMGMTPAGMALQVGARMALPLLSKALGVEQKTGSTINNNQSVTINVNQRDRQEIEQIVYKVMYDKSARG